MYPSGRKCDRSTCNSAGARRSERPEVFCSPLAGVTLITIATGSQQMQKPAKSEVEKRQQYRNARMQDRWNTQSYRVLPFR